MPKPRYRPDMPKGIDDRDADTWEALLAVADAVGGVWPERARKAAVALVSDARDREPSLGIQLLRNLKTVFGESDHLSSKDILSKLHALEESPWGDMRGKPLDERGLANRLRQYGIKPKTVRPDGATSTARGYSRADFYDVWRRYCTATADTPAGKSNTGDTYDITPKDRAFSVSDVSNVAVHVSDDVSGIRSKKPNGTNGMSGVSDVLDIAGGMRVSQLQRCAQCNGEPDGKEQRYGEVWLHEQCRRFWSREGNGNQIV